MDTETRKVTSEHLCRRAYVYVRQSTMKQVVDHTESTERQYALLWSKAWPLAVGATGEGPAKGA